MLRFNSVRRPFCDGSLRAARRADSAADTGVGDLIAFGADRSSSQHVALAEDGIYPEVEVRNLHVADAEHHADVPGLTGVDVGKIRLLRKDRINPFFLVVCRGCFTGKAYHFFIPGVAEHLYSAVRKEFPTEVFAPRGEKVQDIRLVMDGADIAHLRRAMLVHRGESEDAHIAKFFEASLRIHYLISFQHWGSGAYMSP